MSHWVGSWGNALFYNLLYREIFKEVQSLSGSDEGRTLAKFRELMAAGALESAQRHPQIFWFFPDTPEKALKYLNVLWQIFLGVEIGEYTKVQDTEPGTGRDRYIFQIKHCPFCEGYGEVPEDSTKFHAVAKGKPGPTEGLACGLVSMIEQVANNYIMRSTGVRVKVAETGCRLRGAPNLEVTVIVVPEAEWEGGKAEQPPVAGRKPFDLSALEDLVNKPLGAVKEQLRKAIEQQAHMTPQELFGLFENYEEDLVRILGFVPVHLLNEYGNMVEKFTRNATAAKVIGHVYNTVKRSAPLFLPPEVAQDLLNLFLALIEDLAPPAMVERYKKWGDFDYLNLMLEGAGMALRDLGVNFAGLKANVWEEIKAQREAGAAGAGKENAAEVFRQEPGKPAIPKEYFDLVAEVSQLAFELLALPSKILVASTHASAKAVVTARGELLDAIRIRVENLLDIAKQFQEERED